jgi:aldose 1-epimerase
MMEPFGNLSDGRPVEAVTLGAPGELQAQILTYGGLLRRLIVPTRSGLRNVVVTLPDLDAYANDPTFQGILVGRVGNRIANARFELDGRTYRLAANNGANHLHGGMLGFGKKVWRVLDLQNGPRHRLTLGLRSHAGDEGYPGNLDAIAEIALEGLELRLRFEARCDEATPLNLTYHPYFNLSGDAKRSVDEMLLRMPAGGYLPVRDSQLIPTGEIASVEGTPFDFRLRRALKPPVSFHPQLAYGGGYDHCWVLDPSRNCDAELHSPHSHLTMTIHSDRPGIQFYGGQYLPAAHPGLCGICLEPQGFPNAVNEPAFPSVILRAGEIYDSTFRYRFAQAN